MKAFDVLDRYQPEVLTNQCPEHSHFLPEDSDRLARLLDVPPREEA